RGQARAEGRKQMRKKTGFHCWILLLASALFADEPQSLSVTQLGKDFQLVGKLHVPLGSVISIEGIAVEGPFKGLEGGPNLRVQSINGSYTQEDIQIVIKPFIYDWGKKVTVDGDALPKLEMGRTYEMEGYETGGYSGVPSEAFRRGAIPVQTAVGPYFRTHFVVIRAKQTEPIV